MLFVRVPGVEEPLDLTALRSTAIFFFSWMLVQIPPETVLSQSIAWRESTLGQKLMLPVVRFAGEEMRY